MPSRVLHLGSFSTYLPDYQVLICTICRYAIQPGGIPRHLKEIHHIYRSARRPYMEYAATFSLGSPEKINQAFITFFPIPELPLIDGLRCLGPGPCDYLCASTKRMQAHWIATHGRHGNQNQRDWQTALLQTFFKGNLLHYFTDPKATLQNISSQDQSSLLTDVASLPSLLDKHRTWVYHYNQTTILYPGLSFDGIAASYGRLDEMDQILLHHYLTSTYLTLVDKYGNETIWQQAIPQIAAHHPFLMSTLLACSALHLAYIYPSNQKHYMLRAHAHQNVAMPSFNHAFSNINEGNCHAVLAFCHFLFVYSLAADQSEENLLLTDHSSSEHGMMCSWLYFLRNSCHTVCAYWQNIVGGPLQPLTVAWDIEIDRRMPGESPASMTAHLLSILPAVHPTSEVGNGDSDGERETDVWSAKTREIYSEAAIQLGWAFSASQTLKEEDFTTWDAIRVWPAEVSSDYIQLLVNGHPAALVLMAHYCLLVERLQHYWYFEGRASILFQKIMRRLDPKWHAYIKHSYDGEDSLL